MIGPMVAPANLPGHPPASARGRGAKSNRTGRFESQVSEAFDDGWGEEEEPAQIATTVQAMKSRTIIARNDSPDVGFESSINPYRGCSHGCIYCYARPAHTYLGHSAGLDFETKIYFKPEAGKLLERELSKPKYAPKVIHIGGDTDPYQPDERQLRVTRAVIETLSRFRHPFTIITKSNLITRDLDILGPMGRDGLARAAVSITSLDHRLSRSMEPRASTPKRRIDAVRLPLEIKDLFEEWLAAEHPDRARRVMSLVRQMRGGAAYSSEWGKRMTGEGPVAEVMSQRFHLARVKFGLDRKLPPLDLTQFAVPAKAGDQLSLF